MDIAMKFDDLLDLYGERIVHSDWKDKVNVWTFPKDKRSLLVSAMYEAILSGDVNRRGEHNRGLYCANEHDDNEFTMNFRSVDYDGFVEDGGRMTRKCDGYVYFLRGFETIHYDCFSGGDKYYKGRDSDASGNVDSNYILFV